MSDGTDIDDEIITCWCGEEGTEEELFSDDPYLDTCGGTGFLYCHCGGDLCVCHHHGQEIECPGCEDCEGDDADEWFNGYPGQLPSPEGDGL